MTVSLRVERVVQNLVAEGGLSQRLVAGEQDRLQRAMDRGECPECKAQGKLVQQTQCYKHGVIKG